MEMKATVPDLVPASLWKAETQLITGCKGGFICQLQFQAVHQMLTKAEYYDKY